MQKNDLNEADRIVRLAFGTFLGLPDPMKFMGDADYAKTRYEADPSAALVAEIDGRVVGSNFALDWGSVGFFGPLTVHPEYWDKGVAKLLLEETMKIFAKWRTRHTGLFTFAQSAKHVHLYQKFDFWPRYLTAVMSKQADKQSGNSTSPFIADYYSNLDAHGKKDAITECAVLTGEIFTGLDLTKEILSVDRQKLGDTILLKDPNTKKLVGMAVCHIGPGTEAGSGNCYVKFGAVRPSHDSLQYFDGLLNACESYAQSRKAVRIVGGANAGRQRAYKRMIERGFRTDMQGVAMHRQNEPGYNVPEIYVIDDWR